MPARVDVRVDDGRVGQSLSESLAMSDVPSTVNRLSTLFVRDRLPFMSNVVIAGTQAVVGDNVPDTDLVLTFLCRRRSPYPSRPR